jgi:hypothetical protein
LNMIIPILILTLVSGGGSFLAPLTDIIFYPHKKPGRKKGVKPNP